MRSEPNNDSNPYVSRIVVTRVRAKGVEVARERCKPVGAAGLMVVRFESDAGGQR